MLTSAPHAPARLASRSPVMENIHRGMLKKRMAGIPTGPGVYRWLDTNGNVLYVGKAKNLRRRMRTYLGTGALKEGFRKRGLFEKMADLTITVTNTELEALILETHLIRTLKPRYNIQLTKDTHYAFVKITVQDDFPSVQVVHTKESDAALYFGPYSNPYSQRRMVEILRTLYHFRTCRMSLRVNRQESLFADAKRATFPLEIVAKKIDRRLPCLDFHIEKCCGPCNGMIAPDHYRDMRIASVLSFLQGDRSEVLGKLIDRLKQEGEQERKFERAEDVSFALRYVQNMKKQASLGLGAQSEMDAVGYRLYRRKLHVVVLQARGGNIINELYVCASGAGDAKAAFGQFLARYYDDVRDIPERILLSALPDDADILRAWLSVKKGSEVRICEADDDIERHIVDLAKRNAEQKSILQNAKRLIEKGSTGN
jgi:excinuclease ABC subunit C